MNITWHTAHLRGMSIACALLVALSPIAASAQQTIKTIAGNGIRGFSGDGGPATSATLSDPQDSAVDPAGNVYINDTYAIRIRKVTPAGIITTFAGNGNNRDWRDHAGDGGLATNVGLDFISGIAADKAGNIYIGEPRLNRIRKISPDGIITTLAGGEDKLGYAGDGGLAADALITNPNVLGIDTSDSIYFFDAIHWKIRKISSSGIIETFAGNGQVANFLDQLDGLPATQVPLFGPGKIGSDAEGNIYLPDPNDHRIFKISPDGIMHHFAGVGNDFDGSFGGDGGPASQAQFNMPADVAVDRANNVYILDGLNYRVRKIDRSGIITTYAGTGERKFSGDGGPPSMASLNNPVGLTNDSTGNLYITEFEGERVRKIAPFESCAKEGFVSGRLRLCQQICEADHTPAALQGLIAAYIRQHNTAPPCGL